MILFGRYIFYSSGGLDFFFLRKRSVSVANLVLGENLGLVLKGKLVDLIDLYFFGLPFKLHRASLGIGLATTGLTIRNIVDKIPLSYNGCDRKKKIA